MTKPIKRIFYNKKTGEVLGIATGSAKLGNHPFIDTLDETIINSNSIKIDALSKTPKIIKNKNGDLQKVLLLKGYKSKQQRDKERKQREEEYKKKKKILLERIKKDKKKQEGKVKKEQIAAISDEKPLATPETKKTKKKATSKKKK